MGHHDTVPIGDRSLWTFEPLIGEVRDGKIWGRGACDDKYALATSLFLLKLLKEQGFEPKQNLVFTAYCDEESGGSHGALAAVLRYPSKRIVNMDCKNFEIWHCASGGQCSNYRFHVDEPVDSARRAAEAIPVVMDTINAFGKEISAELAENRFYKGTIIPGTALRYFGVRAGGGGNDLNVGQVSFGIYTERTKEQIFEAYDAMHEELKEKLAPLGIIGDGFRTSTRFFHYAFSEPDCEAITEMQQCARETSGRELKPCGSCLSDLSAILKYGSKEAFGFGIGRDFHAYGGAHQPDEYIGCGELLEYAKIMGAYILKSLG
jgi:acetylornithine deacetylase/succinyl-diaminopimelate desuccinylase-like protein